MPMLYGVQETELRTLRAAAEDVATKFDDALQSLSQQRQEVVGEVVAVEGQLLALAVDLEALLTAGPAAEQAAVAKAEGLAGQREAVRQVRVLLDSFSCPCGCCRPK